MRAQFLGDPGLSVFAELLLGLTSLLLFIIGVALAIKFLHNRKTSQDKKLLVYSIVLFLLSLGIYLIVQV